MAGSAEAQRRLAAARLGPAAAVARLALALGLAPVPALGLALGLALAGGVAVASPVLDVREQQCIAEGWSGLSVNVAGVPRAVLWKAPPGPWRSGAVVVLHGGGGQHVNWCFARADALQPQLRFVRRALERGFAVFLPDSSDRVTDREGRACGKVWDDEPRERENLDLPFMRALLDDTIAALRPEGSDASVFLTGLSSGGYMVVRAATQLQDAVAAVAPVSSGDPYGWHRICQAGLTARTTVHGIGVDNDTGKRISAPQSCASESYAGERTWDGAPGPRSPVFRIFHHRDDGVHDRSCATRLERQLARNGYRLEPTFWIGGDGPRTFANHLWQDQYSDSILEFFDRARVRKP